MSTNANTEIVQKFIHTCWNELNADEAERYLHENYVDHAYQPANIAGLRAMVDVVRTAFPNQYIQEESVVSEGDRVIARLRMRGTHLGSFRGKEPTGNHIDVRVIREFLLKEGKIAEHWALLDTATLLRQIGAELHEQPACQVKR